MKKLILTEEEKSSILNQHNRFKSILHERLGIKSNLLLEEEEKDFWNRAEKYNCVGNGTYDPNLKGYYIASTTTKQDNVFDIGDSIILRMNYTMDVYGPGLKGLKKKNIPWGCAAMQKGMTDEQKGYINAIITVTKINDATPGYQTFDKLPDHAKLNPEGNGYTKKTFILPDRSSIDLYIEKSIQGALPTELGAQVIKTLEGYKSQGYSFVILPSDAAKYDKPVDLDMGGGKTIKGYRMRQGAQDFSQVGTVSRVKGSSDAFLKIVNNAKQDMSRDRCVTLIQAMYNLAKDPTGMAAQDATADAAVWKDTRQTVQSCINNHMDRRGLFNLRGHATTKMVEFLTNPRSGVPSGFGFNPAPKK